MRPASSGPHTGMTAGDGWLCTALVGRRGQCLHYLARDERGKIADLVVLAPSDDVAISERGLLDEIAMAGRLPINVSPALIDHGKLQDGTPYFLHKRLVGCWLSDLFGASGEPLDLPTGLDVAIQLADALDVCHRRDLVHRWVKPTTLFITRDGEVRLPPVGDASVVASAWDDTAFTAPELLRNDESATGPGVDVYSVGATLFMVLSGVPPLSADPNAPETYDDPARSVAFAAPWLPLGLIETIDRALRGAPTQRFKSAGELAAALRELLDEVDDAVDAPQDPHGTRRSQLGARVRDTAEGVDPFEREHKSMAMSAVFQHLASAWSSSMPGAELGSRRENLDQAWAYVAPLLDEYTEGVTVEVRPYGLYRRGLPIWQPDRSLRTITNALFSAGFRTVTLRPKLSPEEFERFVGYLQAVGEHGASSPHSVALAFDDARFAGVQADIRVSLDRTRVLRDPTVEQELEELRSEVDEELQDDRWCRGQVAARLVRIRALDTRESWSANDSRSPLIRGARSAYAQLGPPPGIGITSRSLADVKTCVDSDDFLDRQGVTAAAALLQGSTEGGSASVEMSWRAAVHNTTDDDEALAYVLDCIDAIPGALAPGLLSRLLDPVTSRRLLVALTNTYDGRLVEQRIKTLVAALSPGAFDAMLTAYEQCFETSLGAELRQHLQRQVYPEQIMVAQRIASMAAPVALDILDMCRSKTSDLSRISLGALQHQDTGAKVHAVRDSFEEHPAEVLPHVISLLDCEDASVRSSALEVFEQHRPASASRAIYARLQPTDAVARSPGEHKRLLMLLFEISPAEGERHANALVRTHGALPDAELDARRRVAVQLLGSHASSPEALEAAELASGRWWWNTPELRDAARSAVAAIKRRGGVS
ncbi:MAG: hypothetical protein ACI82G_000966 [Bradymonadia bacterium]|jgi:hypothetical protein